MTNLYCQTTAVGAVIAAVRTGDTLGPFGPFNHPCIAEMDLRTN